MTKLIVLAETLLLREVASTSLAWSPILLKYLCVFLLIFILHNCLRFQLRTVTDFDTDHTGSDYLIKSAYHAFPYRITPP